MNKKKSATSTDAQRPKLDITILDQLCGPSDRRSIRRLLERDPTAALERLDDRFCLVGMHVLAPFLYDREYWRAMSALWAHRKCTIWDQLHLWLALMRAERPGRAAFIDAGEEIDRLPETVTIYGYDPGDYGEDISWTSDLSTLNRPGRIVTADIHSSYVEAIIDGFVFVVPEHVFEIEELDADDTQEAA